MKTATWFLALGICAATGGIALAKDYEANPENLRGIVEGLKPGDTVLLADGEYEGGVVIKASGEQGSPIVLTAEGQGALFKGGRDGVRLEGDYIEVEGLKVTAAQRGGVTSGRNTGCAIRKCTCFENGVWGIFSGFSEALVVEDNACYGQKNEHGIYLSNSTDHAVVRRNHCYDNAGCGIQFNGDPRMRGGDGIMRYNLVENNVLHDNFTNLNLACFSDSIVRGNLIYHCNTKAIALWDDANDPSYGSKNNVIINNTVIMDNVTRECIQLRNGSTGNTIRNNILVAPFYSITADNSSAEGTVIDHNLYSGSREPERFIWAGEYRSVADMQGKGFCGGAVLANPVFTSARSLRAAGARTLPPPVAGPRFVDASECDFRLQADSPAVDAGLDDDRAGANDLAGGPRVSGKGVDIGAYEFQATEAP